ncbi:unnamed protein product [Ascophyllum nodosum]
MTMVARTLARLPKLHSTIIAQRCFLPSSGKLVTTNAHRSGSRESGQTNRYAIPQGLVVQTRDIHLTRRNESTVLLAGVGVAVGALAARQALIEFRKYQDAQQPSDTSEGSETMQGEQASKDGEATTAPPGVSAGASGLFGAFGKRYYDGGFDEKMTRKEAALILGVRESAAAQRIKDSHRRILMINHPDKGGSKYMAAKINEAKEILLKGRE